VSSPTTEVVGQSTEESAERGTWTGKVRESTVRAFPPDRLLPDRQPAYVASWIYVFGALTIGAFIVVLLSGGVLAIEGPAWWHKSTAGLFVNSLHMWSTEFFFMFMVVHLWGKFFMAAWRGRRKATWITGVIAFVTSIGAAFTGYLSQQNFDSEWISTQAKDGINSTGIGAFWNVLNFGQMFMWHIVLLPLLVAVIIGIHVLLVRRRGVVPPFAPTEGQLAKAGLTGSLVGVSGAAPMSTQDATQDAAVPLAQEDVVVPVMPAESEAPPPSTEEDVAPPASAEEDVAPPASAEPAPEPLPADESAGESSPDSTGHSDSPS